MASGSITASVTTFALTLGTSTSYADKTLAPSAVAYATTGNVARMDVKRVAATGAFTLTGNAAKSARKMPGATGTFGLTGNAAVLTFGGLHKLVGTVTPFTLTGRDAHFDHEWRMSGAVGTVAVTGNAATITYGGVRKITGTVTPFTVTGNAATLISSKNYILFCPMTRDAIFTVNGGDSTSYRDYVLASSTKSYVVTANDAALKGSALLAATGTFYVSGKPAGLSPSTRKIIADVGTFAATGNAANLSRSSVALLSAATGSFTLVGGTSTSLLYTNYTLSAAKGSVALTGQAATWGSELIIADTGAFLLAGKSAVSARYDYHTKGTFTLTGRSALGDRGIAAVPVSVSLVGRAATLTKTGGHVLSAATGSILETGNAATLWRPRTIAAAKGTFVETGRAATGRPGKALTASVTPFALTGNAAVLQRAGAFVLFCPMTRDAIFTVTPSPAFLNVSGIYYMSAGATSYSVQPVDATLISASYLWIDYPYIVNAADTSVRWVHLYEITLPSPAAPIRWTDDLLPVISGGLTFAPYVVNVDAVTTEQGQVATGTLTVGNADNLFGNVIFTQDLTGSVVKIWQAWMNPHQPTQISASMHQIFVGRVSGISLARSGQDSTATVTLGPYSDPSTKIFPPRLTSDILRR
jgi:hypothetical protein